jgi:hypothetical protein
MTPPPFCKSGFSHTTGTTHAAVISVYGTVIKLVISSTPSLSDDFLATSPDTPNYELLASPFWNLLLLFEALIFQPKSSSKELVTTLSADSSSWPMGTLRNCTLK